MINTRISADWSTTKPFEAFSCTPCVQDMINTRISADWSTTKPFEAFSCTPCVQEVHTKAEVVHHTPGL